MIYDSFDVAVAEGVAGLLSHFGTWGDTVSSADIALTYRVLPKSGHAVAISPYAGVDSPRADGTTEQYVQLRIRGDNVNPRACDELSELCFQALHGRTWCKIGPELILSDCRRVSQSAPVPVGTTWEGVSNYVLLLTHHNAYTH